MVAIQESSKQMGFSKHGIYTPKIRWFIVIFPIQMVIKWGGYMMLYGNTLFSDTPNYHIVGCIPFYPITFPVNPQCVDDLPNKYPIRSHLPGSKRDGRQRLSHFSPALNGAPRRTGPGWAIHWVELWWSCRIKPHYFCLDPWVPFFVNRPSVNQELVFQEPDPDVTNVQSSAQHRRHSFSRSFLRVEVVLATDIAESSITLPHVLRPVFRVTLQR